ncbi:MAG: lysozyme inhibitor LprI family protein [Janthinobacterium lividum]
MHRAGSSTVQAGLCAQSEFSRQDQRLNYAYQHLLAPLPPHSSERLQLRDSERAWLAHRDQTCRRNAQTIDNGCLIRSTADRADALERRAEQH